MSVLFTGIFFLGIMAEEDYNGVFDVKPSMVFTSNIDQNNIGEKFDSKSILTKLSTVLADILAQTFRTTPVKQEIREGGKSLNFACPICGDSKHSDREKRGHIYYDDLNFKCWNCAAWMPLPNFLSKFGAENLLTASEIQYLRNTASERKGNYVGSGNFANQSSELFGIDEFAIPRSHIMARGGLIDIEKNMKILNYLRGRLQVPRDGDLRHFAYDPKNDLICFFNTLMDREKVIGLQFRNQRARKGDPRFISYRYSEIWLKIIGKEDVDEEITKKVDKFSLYYNVMRTNYAKSIYIFEGTMDANHMENSMATWGASTKIFLDQGFYFYDNTSMDKAGRDASIAMLKKGHYVFLWNKFLDKYPIYRFCKDLNDIMRKKPISQSAFKDFFSNDVMDMLYL